MKSQLWKFWAVRVLLVWEKSANYIDYINYCFDMYKNADIFVCVFTELFSKSQTAKEDNKIQTHFKSIK